MGVLRHGKKKNNRKLMSALPSAYFMAGNIQVILLK